MLVAGEEGILLVANKKKELIGNSESTGSPSGFVCHGNAAVIPQGEFSMLQQEPGLDFWMPGTWFGTCRRHQQMKGCLQVAKDWLGRAWSSLGSWEVSGWAWVIISRSSPTLSMVPWQPGVLLHVQINGYLFEQPFHFSSS